jgi:SAM-dependent methyltransferase
MKSVAEHYAEHLAPIYLWMAGGAESALAAGNAELDALHLPARAKDAVLDLGAGFGMHAIPLAQRGAHVTAVDTSAELLEHLHESASGFPIRTVHADLVEFMRQDHRTYDAILCMGDTLMHLPSHEEVDELLAFSVGALAPRGVLVLTFRDYSTALREEDRFIPVKSDEDRIMTCFLDFRETTLLVHDIVHEREPNRRAGAWTTRVSAYRKLRIPPQKLIETLEGLGLNVRREAGLRGMVRLVATRVEA